MKEIWSFVWFFVYEKFPTPEILIVFSGNGLVWAVVTLGFAGILKKRGVKTGYTRKVFHFLIFSGAAYAQVKGELPGVLAYSMGVSLVVMYAVLKGEGDVFYESIAREKDAPNRTMYVIIPYLSTAVGGLVSNYFFGNAAVAGYLVAGLGDAAGEPVGTMFGKHRYKTPLSGTSFKTAEGSAGVFAASLVAIVIGNGLIQELDLSVWIMVQMSLGFMLIEALSPRGMDNFLMQVAPAWVVSLYF